MEKQKKRKPQEDEEERAEQDFYDGLEEDHWLEMQNGKD